MRYLRLVGLVLLASWLVSGAAQAESPQLEVQFPRNAGTVGDRFPLTLLASGDDADLWEPLPLPEKIGPFQVYEGAWERKVAEDGTVRWTWTGSLAAFEVGTLQIPAFPVRFQSGEQLLEVTTRPLEATIESVLAGEGQNGDLADLKAPAAVDPDFRFLFLALGILAGLLGAAGVLWWLQRRYAGRLAAVPQPPDPFQRMPPHEWAYQALQELLGDGSADPDHAGPFFEEIARILKLYLGARFRLDVMECTTAEIGPLLRQAGATDDSMGKTDGILARCDMVKFADHRPGQADFRTTVEEAYALVDATRPSEEQGRGAA